MTGPLDRIARWFGRRLSAYLSQASHVHGTAAPVDPARFMACLQPGDVLLVDGQTRLSTAIKYLTQSTWSHAALFVAGATGLVVRHHSLFVPRDLDVSPYFAVIKPTLVAGFDHRALAWHDRLAASDARAATAGAA